MEKGSSSHAKSLPKSVLCSGISFCDLMCRSNVTIAGSTVAVLSTGVSVRGNSSSPSWSTSLS